jgi:hypothetical protein
VARGQRAKGLHCPLDAQDDQFPGEGAIPRDIPLPKRGVNRVADRECSGGRRADLENAGGEKIGEQALRAALVEVPEVLGQLGGADAAVALRVVLRLEEHEPNDVALLAPPVGVDHLQRGSDGNALGVRHGGIVLKMWN